MTRPDALERDYRVAFLRYLPRHEEAALHTAYALGRTAVADGVSLLELARVHSEVLRGVLTDTRPAQVGDVATAAGEFLLEALAAYDMAARGLRR